MIDYLVDLATRSRRRLMIRLVKGAYWDSEIKRAQMDGLEGYPVYTRKVYTDVSYLACAKKLLAVPNLIYPRFMQRPATLAAIYQLAGQNYYRVSTSSSACMVWASHCMSRSPGKLPTASLTVRVVFMLRLVPMKRCWRIWCVACWKTVLTTSFVNRIADTSLPLDELVADPVTAVEKLAQQEGPNWITASENSLPRLYGHGRDNSAGLDLANEHRLASLSSALLNSALQKWQALPMLEQPVAAR